MSCKNCALGFSAVKSAFVAGYTRSSGWYSAGLAIDSSTAHAEVFLLEFGSIVINVACIDLGLELAFLVLELCDFVIAGTFSLSADSHVEVKIFEDSLLGCNLHF